MSQILIEMIQAVERRLDARLKRIEALHGLLPPGLDAMAICEAKGIKGPGLVVEKASAQAVQRGAK